MYYQYELLEIDFISDALKEDIKWEREWEREWERAIDELGVNDD